MADSSAPQSTGVQQRPTFDVPSGDGTPVRRATTNTNIARATSRTSQASGNSLFRALAKPSKPVGDAPPLFQSVKAIITMSWLNVLLACVPVSWALHFALSDLVSHAAIIFVFSLLAIIPLVKLLAFATDELSMRVGPTLAAIMDATLSNAAKLIVAIIALIKSEPQVVQLSLVGSILSSNLLVLGLCFFVGGIRHSEQTYRHGTVELDSSLLTIFVAAVLLLAAFHTTADALIPDSKKYKDILAVRYGVAIVLLLIYGSFLVFQLSTYRAIHNKGHPGIFKSTKSVRRQKKNENPGSEPTTPTPSTNDIPLTTLGISGSDTSSTVPSSPNGSTQRDVEAVRNPGEEQEEPETPKMSVPLTITLLVVVTGLVAVTAECLVDSISVLADTGTISREFIGLILLPTVGNVAEHVAAVADSLADKTTFSLGVAFDTSIQIALFVIPFIVTLGWMLGKPLSLLFDPFESIVLCLSVLVVNYVVQDGKSNWLKGMILMCLYLMITVTFWYYPGVNELQSLLSC